MAVMLRSKFRNSFLKNIANRSNYSKQRNLFVILFQTRKTEYFENLDKKNSCDNKKFYSVVKPSLSDNVLFDEIKNLLEDNKLPDKDKRTTTIFSPTSLKI